MLRLQGRVTRVNDPRPYELDDGTKGVSRKFVVLDVAQADIHTVTLREGQPDVRVGDDVDLAVNAIVTNGRLKIRAEGQWLDYAPAESRAAVLDSSPLPAI